MSVLLGSSMTTHLALDALAIIHNANVYCGTDFPFLHFGFCMTYNSTTGATEYGACPYIAHYNTTTAFDHVNSIFSCQVMCLT